MKEQGANEQQIKDYVKTQKNKSDEHYYKTISEFTNEKNQYELELSKLIAQNEALEKGKEQYQVVAQKSGVIHLNTPLTSGMVLQGGSLIGTITSKEEELIVDTMLPSSDRPRIHVGDEVALAVGGLLQSEYGTIPGKVTESLNLWFSILKLLIRSIEEEFHIKIEDATKSDSPNLWFGNWNFLICKMSFILNLGNVFFKVKVKPNKTYLEDSKGEKVNLTLGMVAETRVKYEKISEILNLWFSWLNLLIRSIEEEFPFYMKYILELIGIKFS